MLNKNNYCVEFLGTGSDVIVTLVIGHKYLKNWIDIVQPLWVQYCKNFNLSLISIREPISDPGEKRYDWQKLLCGTYAKLAIPNCKRVCFVDYDIVPNPFSENIFNLHEVGTVGFVSQRKNLPYGELDYVLRSMAFSRHDYSNGSYSLDSYLTVPTQKIFTDHGLPPYDDYGCGGLFMFDVGKYANYFKDAFFNHTKSDILIANAGEEVYLNHYIQSTGNVNWLDYKWQALWCYECGVNYPIFIDPLNTDSDLIKKTTIHLLKKFNFIHFVGSWEKHCFDKLRGISVEDMKKTKAWKEYLYSSLQSPSLGQIYPK